MKSKILTLLFVLLTQINFGQNLPLLKISNDHSYIVNQSNEPFFWMGGTAWELIHRCNKQEIDIYLTDRAEKGFTVIQTVILAELDGLNTPNAYGEKPLINNDPLLKFCQMQVPVCYPKSGFMYPCRRISIIY